MINHQNSIKVIKFVYNKLSKNLQKIFYEKSIAESFSYHHQDKHSSELIHYKVIIIVFNLFQNLFIPKKDEIVKQNDIYNNIYRKFLELETRKNETLNNKKIEFIFKTLLFYLQSLNLNKIPPQNQIVQLIIDYLQIIKNINFISMCFQYHIIPDNYEIAKFLIQNKWETQNNTMIQIGLDMLIRLGKFDDVFIELVKLNYFIEALRTLKRYSIKLDNLDEETQMILKENALKNKELIKTYLNNY